MESRIALWQPWYPQDPKNWAEAMKSKDKQKWIVGMEREMDSIRKRGVWKPIPPSMIPRGRKVIS
jgi:hypothetical protein